MKATRTLLAALLVLIASGCEDANPVSQAVSPATNGSSSSTPATPAPEPAAATEGGASSNETSSQAPFASTDSVATEVVTWEQVQEIVKSHQGKVVVLDLWSTYCPPCIKELPGLVKLHDKYPADVVCLTLNCNFNGLGSPHDEKDEIIRVLTEVGAKGRNLVSKEADTELYQRIGIASIPVVYVYDRTGQLAKTFDNEKGEYPGEGFNYADHIAPLVESLVR